MGEWSMRPELTEAGSNKKEHQTTQKKMHSLLKNEREPRVNSSEMHNISTWVRTEELTLPEREPW